jgi:hypothetical protein
MRQVSYFFLIIISSVYFNKLSNKYISLLHLLQTSDDYGMLLCCLCFDGVVDVEVSIAGGFDPGVVDVLMVGDREGVAKIDGCHLLVVVMFEQDIT